MKKVVVISCTFLLIIMLLTACFWQEQPECLEHTFGEYQSNDEGHWREYTCGCSNPNTFEEHLDIDSDNSCDACGYDVHKHLNRNFDSLCDICGICLHDIADTIYFDKNQHWQEYLCECKNLEFRESHTDENNDNKCDECNFILDCEHVWSEDTKRGVIAVDVINKNLSHCTICGEVKVLDSEGTGEIFPITVESDLGSYILNDIPTEARAGSIITLRVPIEPSYDKYLYLEMNNLYVRATDLDDTTVTLAFIMPDDNVTLTIALKDKDDYHFVVFPGFLYYYLPWLYDLNPDNVVKIKMKEHIMDTPYGTVDDMYTIDNKEDIAALIYQLKWSRCYDIQGFTPGNNPPKQFFDVILSDGTVYSFYIECGYLNGWINLEHQPTLNNYASAQHSHTLHVGWGYGLVYDYALPSNQIACFNDVDKWEFVFVDEENFPQSEPTHSIKINYTTLYVVDENSFYYFNENEEKICCRLVNRNFYDMFTENSVYYNTLVGSFLAENPELTTAYLHRFYGISETGAILGRIISDEIEYTNYTGRYNTYPIYNPQQIYIFYENTLYTLSEAYKNGYVTTEDLKAMYIN